MELVTCVGGSGGAGTTTVAARLALALAHTGRRIALIDAHLGLGNLHTLLNLPPAPGLAEVLAGQCSLREAMHATVGGIRAVTVGAYPDPTRPLATGERLRLLEELDSIAGDSDVVLLDSGSNNVNTFFFASIAHHHVFVAAPGMAVCPKTAATLVILSEKRPKSAPHVLVNRAPDAAEGLRTFAELAGLVPPSLCVELHYVGTVPFSPELTTDRWRPSDQEGPLQKTVEALGLPLIGAALPQPRDSVGRSIR